jgi:flagellar basal-body rod protein FlgB
MFINDLIDDPSTRMMEQFVRFTEVRQNLLTQDVANVSTPGYHQQDLSVSAFQDVLRQQMEAGSNGGDAGGDPVAQAQSHPGSGILSHDGNNRSMEQLMSDGAKNALMHNTVVELLRDQYSSLDMALKDRVG